MGVFKELEYRAFQRYAVREAGMQRPESLPIKERLKRLQAYNDLMDAYTAGKINLETIPEIREITQGKEI